MERILVIHAGALGDLVNTAPALAALRRARPSAEIAALGRTELLALPLRAGIIDKTISLEAPGMHTLFGPGPLSPSAEGLLAGADLVVSWLNSPDLDRHARLLAKAVSFSAPPFPPPRGSPHATEVLASPVEALGIAIDDYSPRLERAASPPASEGEDYFIVHPGSGSISKNWPAGRFVHVARSLAETMGIAPIVLLGPADEGPAEKLRELAPDLKIAEGLSVTGLAELLAGARLVVGNDSGVTHLAGAMGAPAVAVFGPADPAIWGVRQTRAINIAPRGVGCAPCGLDRARGCRDRVCLGSVKVESVIEAGLTLFAARRP